MSENGENTENTKNAEEGIVEENIKAKMAGNGATTMLGTVYGKGSDFYRKFPERYDKYLLFKNNNNNDKEPPHEINKPGDIKISEGFEIFTRRLFRKFTVLSLVFGGTGAGEILDNISKIVLNTDDLSNIDEHEVIQKFEKKVNNLKSLTKNPRIRELLGEASKAVGEIFVDFIEHANEPMMKIGEKASAIGYNTLLKMFNQYISTSEDAFKLIPIIGDSYMILQNMIDMIGTSFSVGQGSMRLLSDVSESYVDISNALGNDKKYNQDKENLSDIVKEINNLIKEFTNNVENEVERDISDYGGIDNEKEERKTQNELSEEFKKNKEEEENQNGGSIFKKSGNAKTLKNRLGGSNNLTRRNRF